MLLDQIGLASNYDKISVAFLSRPFPQNKDCTVQRTVKKIIKCAQWIFLVTYATLLLNRLPKHWSGTRCRWNCSRATKELVLQSTGATGIVDIIRIIPLMRAAVSGWMENTQTRC